MRTERACLNRAPLPAPQQTLKRARVPRVTARRPLEIFIYGLGWSEDGATPDNHWETMEYLKALAPDKKNMLIFVGYQSEGTLGRRIQKGGREIPLRSEEGRARTLRIDLEIETAHGFSGHSSYEQLMSFVRRLGHSLQRIITNHGEPQRCVGMARELHKIHRIETYAPRNLESIRLV